MAKYLQIIQQPGHTVSALSCANMYMPICSACLQGEKTSESFDSSATGFNKVEGRRQNQVQKGRHCCQHRPRRMHP